MASPDKLGMSVDMSLAGGETSQLLQPAEEPQPAAPNEEELAKRKESKDLDDILGKVENKEEA